MTALDSDSLKTELFYSFLKNHFGDETFQVIPLAGDASARRYYRVVHNESAWVLMSWEPFVDDGKYPFLSVLRHFAKHNVLVPKVVDLLPQDGLVLLEDLGDLTLERKFWENQNHDLALPFYRQSIDELIKIHYRASKDSKAKCVAFDIAFDSKKLMWEMNYGFEHLIDKLCHVKISEKTKSDLYAIFTEICDTLDREPKFICHRDYHSRNIMLKHGKTRIIDFQDARMGPIQYDLVSLVKDSYVDISPGMGKGLLEYYLEQRLSEGFEKVVWDKFIEVYEIQSIQRCFKACGSFASFFNLRQDKRYLKYLPGTLQRVKKSIECFPKFKLFDKILGDNGFYSNKFEF